VHARVFEAAGAQDLHRPVEVDVGDLGALDLLVRGRVEIHPPGTGVLFAQSGEPFPLVCLRRIIANKDVNKSMQKSVVQKYTRLQVKCKDMKRVGLQAGPFGDSLTTTARQDERAWRLHLADRGESGFWKIRTQRDSQPSEHHVHRGVPEKPLDEWVSRKPAPVANGSVRIANHGRHWPYPNLRRLGRDALRG
jgi:hypothetical protein